MTSLRKFALTNPEKLAARAVDSDDSLTFGALDSRSENLAWHLVERGAAVGDAVAILMGNTLRYFEVAWAARRAGVFYVPISSHLTAAETSYIIQDSGAKFLFVSESLLDRVEALEESLRHSIEVIVVDDKLVEGQHTSYSAIVNARRESPDLPDRPVGMDFAYSSGTTGRPKGIKPKVLSDSELQRLLAADWLRFFKLSPDTVYLSPAPLYHAAPLRFCMRVIASGGTALVMKKFDARRALELIQEYRVTHSQWVPTMFVRLLDLPGDVRSAFDLSSMQFAMHAAAPCPKDVKLEIMKWWGPIVWEYYSGSERNGATVISPEEWMAHQGSVGRAVSGELRIVAEDGSLAAPRQEGVVYFENGPKFDYHNDPKKTADAYNEHGWSTIGDIGYVDEEGFLYLTDRKSNMIISGGVNIYPQEAENILQGHASVADVAVFGVPHPDFGEQVVAVVQTKTGVTPSDALASELIDFCRSNLAHFKCPRKVDFAQDLPRTETGKLLKRVARDEYRARLLASSQLPAQGV
jgi:long-chain acyl-CoA synthetase